MEEGKRSLMSEETLSFESSVVTANCFWPDDEGLADEAAIARWLSAALEAKGCTQVGEMRKIREASVRGWYFCADGERLLPNA